MRRARPDPNLTCDNLVCSRSAVNLVESCREVSGQRVGGGAGVRAADVRASPRSALAGLVAEHHALREGGAVHLVATFDGRDVGLLTVELTSPVPRLCPDGQPYIGPTATLPEARGQGVRHALVAAALTWAYDHGYQWVSVDFDTANPLSWPFWLNAGFRPAGYGVLSFIDGIGQMKRSRARDSRQTRRTRRHATRAVNVCLEEVSAG